MSIRHLAKLLFCILPVLSLNSAAPGQGITPQERQRILVQQDVKAAGNSGDKSFIPDLYEIIEQRKHDHKEWDDVQMALAKLGNRQQQQNIVCVFYRGDKYEAQVADAKQLPYIGGWFAVQLYREMLTNEKIMSHWFRAEPQDPGDVVMMSPQSSALNYLPKLIPDLPSTAVPGGERFKPVRQIVTEWTAYIKSHEDRLSALEPGGHGVDFSGKSCTSKSRERSINR